MRASINASEAFSPLAQVLLAVIYQPILDIVYTATLERGAYLNQERLCVQQNAPSLSKSTICRVLSYGMHNHKLARQVMNILYGRTRRRLDTGMVAGLFLFQEAGGYLGDLENGHIIDNVAQVESVIAATSLPLLKDIWRTIDYGS